MQADCHDKYGGGSICGELK